MIHPLTPIRCQKQWQFRKYSMALLPLLVILISFLISIMGINTIVTRVATVVGLVWYMAVSFLFRLTHPSPVQDSRVIVSPLHGRVKDILREDNTIRLVLEKTLLDASDLRCPHARYGAIQAWEHVFEYDQKQYLIRFSGSRPVFFGGQESVTGSLIGVVIGSSHVTMTLYADQLERDVMVKKGDVLIAGETIVAKWQTSASEGIDNNDIG